MLQVDLTAAGHILAHSLRHRIAELVQWLDQSNEGQGALQINSLTVRTALL